MKKSGVTGARLAEAVSINQACAGPAASWGERRERVGAASERAPSTLHTPSLSPTHPRALPRTPIFRRRHAFPLLRTMTGPAGAGQRDLGARRRPQARPLPRALPRLKADAHAAGAARLEQERRGVRQGSGQGLEGSRKCAGGRPLLLPALPLLLNSRAPAPSFYLLPLLRTNNNTQHRRQRGECRTRWAATRARS